MSFAESTPVPIAGPRGWNCFPVNTLLADGRMQRLVPKLLWLIVPLAYYYATTINGGLNKHSLISAAAYVVLLVTSMAVAGGLIAIALRRSSESGFDTARGLIATLLGVWAVALALECLSYYATVFINPLTPANVVLDLLCFRSAPPKALAAWLGLSDWTAGICIGWPGLVMSVLSHLIYALVGALLLATIIRAISRHNPATAQKPRFEPVPEPNIFLAALVVGVLMRVFDSVITYVS